jgi:hypothetical protein
VKPIQAAWNRDQAESEHDKVHLLASAQSKQRTIALGTSNLGLRTLDFGLWTLDLCAPLRFPAIFQNRQEFGPVFRPNLNLSLGDRK